MDLNAVLSDKPVPVRAESATEVKPAVETKVETKPEPAATSAATETKPETKVEPAKVETQAEAEARGRDDKGRFVRTVPQEALHAERAKRQQLEQRLQELETKKPVTSVLENEDQAFTERLNKATQPLMERFFKLSVKAARNAPNRTDFEEVASAFSQAAESDPKLWESFRASDDPGEYVYTVGKQIRELGDVGGDILKYGDKKRAEGAAEAEALKQKIAALDAEIATLKGAKDKQEKIPGSLNGEQSATTKGATFVAPAPLKSIFN